MSSRWGCSLHLSSFYAAPPPQTHAHHHLFHPFIPMLRGRRKKKEWKRSWYLWQSWGPHRLCLIAEVFDLINDTGLCCEPNRTQIKTLVMLKMLRVKGQLFHSLLDDISTYSLICLALYDMRVTALVVYVSRAAGISCVHFSSAPLPRLLPQWSCYSVSVGCTNSFSPIFYLAFHYYLLLLFHPFLTPLSYQLSSQSHILISTHITFTSSR